MSQRQPTLAGFQRDFAAYLRDPLRRPPPQGLAERPARLYGELLFNNVASALDGCLPVSRQQLDAARWEQLQRGFFRDRPTTTPLLWQIPGEFAAYLAEHVERLDLPPWLPELAHYEWIELAVDTCTAPAPPCTADGDLIAACPVLDPSLQRLCYAWPVHRIVQGETLLSPDPSLLLIWRDNHDRVRIEQISAPVARLLELLGERRCSGRQACLQLATEMQLDDPAPLLGFAAGLLERLRQIGVVAGSLPPPD